MGLRPVGPDRLALALPDAQMAMIDGPNRKTMRAAVTIAAPVRKVM